MANRRRLNLLLVLLALLLTGWILMPSQATTDVHPHHDKLVHPDGSWKYTNALIDETSPYLLQHAHNPVDWHPWGERAFELARQQNKPVFLSVGYSTCYWCHVMERQVFEDPEIARQMNEKFINIKVDREERPDVDDIYMTATQVMTGHGGWPMSVFLTPPGAAGADDPGLRPFFAGTYFPPEPKHGMPSFPQVLDAVHDAWQNRREPLLKQADQITALIQRHLSGQTTTGELDPDPVRSAANAILRTYDHEHGGFGGAPKFPTPNNLAFLLAVHRHNPDPDLVHAIRHTLDRMARGGMYDQVGGGFHRYSTDARWLVPHFEKMLYDNGQLLELYAHAITLDPDHPPARPYARVLRETADYVLREMTDPTGAFWSAQDAEVNAREGGNYLWTEPQVHEAIDDPTLADFAVRLYGLDRGTNFRDPHDPDAEPANVLYLPRPLTEWAEDRGVPLDQIEDERRRINAALLAVRDRREQPGTDDKVLVSWNGLMIAGLAAAGRVLDESAYTDAAARAADAILEHMTTDDGGLYRTMRKGQAKIPAFLEDYAFFVHGLIALHRARPDESRWLELATQYTRAAIDRFAAEHGGYFDTLADQTDLFVRTRGVHDGAVPSGNSQMIHNLLDLAELTGDPSWRQRAERDLRSFVEPMRQTGQVMAHMQHALLRALEAGAAADAADRTASPTPGETSSDEVAVTLTPASLPAGATEADATVTLDIAAGYHVNGPGAPDPLIPTRIEATGSDWKIEADYPRPTTRQLPFADAPMPLYEGRVTIPLRLRWAGDGEPSPPTIAVTFQACTETECHPPRRVERTPALR